MCGDKLASEQLSWLVSQTGFFWNEAGAATYEALLLRCVLQIFGEPQSARN